MPSDAADNLISAHPATTWEAQDAPARRATLTRILVRISREALQGASIDSLLRGICECLVAELPVAIASVVLLDEACGEFVQEVYAGERTCSPLVTDGRWPVSVGVIGRCACLGAKLLIADVARDRFYVAGNPRVRSEYLVPIRHGQRLHGVLNIECVRTDFFDPESCAVFDAVADLVAGAIHFARMADELQRANHRLEELSMLDGLTGIANRRRFDRQLQADWQRLAGEGQSLALLMVDADAFKPLNDICGHLYGDECLRALAQLCGGFAREAGDLACRFGGEELVLLLPGRGLEAATGIAEALRAAVEQRAMPHPASSVSPYVTVSIGVAAQRPDAAGVPDVLVEHADRALYAAKSGGRNRVCTEPVNLAAASSNNVPEEKPGVVSPAR